MAKSKLRRLHKIKIHKNRWLIWAIAYVVIVTIAVVGYIKVSDVNFETQITADSVITSYHSYNDNRLGFGVRYPSDWGIESDSPSTIVFQPNSSQEGVTISVTPTTAEKAIRKSLKIASETTTIVDGIAAAQITNDLGVGAMETVVLVKANQQLYEISGPDASVQKFLTTFHFISLTK